MTVPPEDSDSDAADADFQLTEFNENKEDFEKQLEHITENDLTLTFSIPKTALQEVIEQ